MLDIYQTGVIGPEGLQAVMDGLGESITTEEINTMLAEVHASLTRRRSSAVVVYSSHVSYN